MAKRFTDSDKWRKKWFRALSAKMKLFWIYMCDTCNIGGIWDVDFELASFMIGESVLEDEAIVSMEKQIKVLSPTKWQLIDYVPFQYGELTPNNNLHRSVLRILEISGANEGLNSPLSGDKVKVKVKDKVIKGVIGGDLLFESLWSKYPKKIDRKAAERHFRASVKTQEDESNIQKALENYLASKRVYEGFVMNGGTFFNQWRDWIVQQDKLCQKCKGRKKFISSTGYEINCDCK